MAYFVLSLDGIIRVLGMALKNNAEILAKLKIQGRIKTVAM